MTQDEDIRSARLPHRKRGSRVFLTWLGVVAVIAVLIYLLQNPARRQLARLEAAGHAPAGQAVTMQTGPAPPPDDMARIDAEDARIAQMQRRLDALEQRVAGLPAVVAPDAVSPAATGVAGSGDALVAALSARLDGLAAQLATQAAQIKTTEAQLQADAGQAHVLAALSDRATRLARVQAAQAALAAGLPLGTWPGAPAALARFATAPPPTEAQLRLAFPAAAAAAREAAPGAATAGFWRALRARADALITVRRGDQVLLGGAVAATLERAREDLEAGDLDGAVAVLGGLGAPVPPPIAAWRAQAQALLDARAALARLAAQG